MAKDDAMETAPDPVEGEEKKEEKKVEEVEEEVELSEADMALKEELEGLVAQVQSEDTSVHKAAYVSMKTSICASTSTMTSVPKPLKFLRPHFDTLKETFTTITDAAIKASASDVVSLLAMTQEGSRDTLNFRLTGSNEPLADFGHEYVRHLSGQIASEFAERSQEEPPRAVDDLITLVQQIVPYDMSNNAEAEACDLAMEVGKLELLEEFTDEKAYNRVCLYLFSCVPYVPEPDDDVLKMTCLNIYRKFGQWPQAMQMALKLNNLELITEIFVTCKERTIRRQLAFMLARQQVVLDVEELLEDDDSVDDDEIEVLGECIRNTKLNESFHGLARELDIMEAKTPEDIYKTHLETGAASRAANVDSSWANLASTFVNAFVNVGFGDDKLILSPGDERDWIFRNKDDRMTSAAASLGMLLLWDVDGLQHLSPYMENMSTEVKAGALLGVGIVNAGVSDENEPAKALLEEYITNKKMEFRVGAIAGLGMAYAGTGNEEVGQAIIPALVDPASTMEVVGVAALALGQIFVGTSNGDITEELITVLVDKEEKDLAHPSAKFLVLGLGLIYLGRQAAAEVAIESMTVLPTGFQKMAKMLIEICAYAGTGNVLKVQAMLHACSEHVDVDDDDFKEGDDTFQAFATLGVAMIAMGEDMGSEMALRSFNNLLQYGEPVIRRAVPIAIALLCVSNPKLSVLDTLSKLSHDPDAETAYAAIFALGMVGGGTNHARIAQMLRTLAQYYGKDPQTLFIVRVAQGILHAGKGSVTLSPFHTERSLMSPVAIAGLLATFVSCMDMKNVIMAKGHYMLFHLALSMYPRILCTFLDDEDFTPINTSVRVGQAVDVVGQAGKPKTITGFVTSNTPVLLGFSDRAQLATDEYIPVTPLMEGFVILKKNPDYDA